VEIVEKLQEVLRQVGNSPLIVRSSSLLEDNFGSSFAGKYQSYFCPNQGSEEENLRDLLDAIRRVYASTLNPEVAPWRLLFRQGEIYERLPPPQQEEVAHHLEEIKVVLIKGMISDIIFRPSLASVSARTLSDGTPGSGGKMASCASSGASGLEQSTELAMTIRA